MMPAARDVRDSVEQHLDRHVRPFLTSHAGGVHVLGVDATGRVDVEFVGACAHCPISGTTFFGAVEPALLDIDGITHVNPPSNVNISRAAAARVAALSRPRPQSTTTEEGLR